MPAISAQQLIDGLYIAFYNRSADQPGYLFWENQVSLTQAQATSITLVHQNYQYASPLGQQFFSTQSTYFNSQYSALSNSAFVNQIYINFGGNAADTNGLNYWVGFLATQSRQQVALQIAQDFLTIDLTLSTGLTAAELAAAQARQQTFLNKVTVSESFSAASATHPFLVAATASSSDPAFNAAIDIVQNVTAAASSVTTAQALITAAVTAGNVTPITLASTPPLAVTLTLGTDTITGSGVGSDVITAPVLFNAGTATTLTTLQIGDTITETGANNVLNLTVGASDRTISGETIAGVQTFNITNSGFTGSPVIVGAGITGLTAVNNVNSSQAVGVGSAASPLATALTTVGVAGTSGTPNTTRTTVNVTPTALAGPTDRLQVNASNAGSAATPALVLVGPGTGTNGYEAISLAVTGTDFVGLGNPVSGANTTTSLVITGAGTASVFGDGSATNDFTSLATVDGSAATGGITLTGAFTAPGNGVGLLTGDSALKSVKGGAGADVADLSSLSLSQFNANATTVDLGAGRNTLVVDQTVATTTNPLVGVTNVQILGLSNPGSTTGTIDLSKLPTAIDTLKLFGAQGANPVTVTNGPGLLTFDAGIFGSGGGRTTIAAAGTGIADLLNLIEGSTTAGNPNNEFFTTTGYETINLTSQGGFNQVAQIASTASAGGTTALSIGGTTALTILAPANGPGISGINAVTITNTGLTVLATTVNTGSTDARTLNAVASGGLVMGGVETGNIGANGQAIVGSAVAGKSNILIGSPGNDAITGGTASDVIATDGGGDTITLGAHVKDRIEIYGVSNGATNQTLGSVQGAAANSITDTADRATGGGFWGQVPGAATVSIFTLFPGTSAATFGTSADQSTVSGFLVGGAGDSLDVSLQSFGTAAAGHRGLTTVDGGSAAATGASSLTTVSSGGSLSGTTADVVVIAGSTFANASALAQALKTGTFGLNLSINPTAGWVANMLFAYNDAAGNGHIADVAINEVANNRSFAAQTNVIAQDLVQLTGVSVGNLTGNNIQIVG